MPELAEEVTQVPAEMLDPVTDRQLTKEDVFSSDDNLAMKIKDSNNNKTQAFPSSNPTGPSANVSSKMSASSTSRKVYGLRPRTSMRRPRSTSPVDVPATVAEPKKIYDEPSASSCSVDASLPSPAAPSPTKGKGSSSKPRVSKSKPLSRYRRITANARERDRMKEINSAFATLRAVLPTFANSRIASMTKYSTLQLAASYIKALSDILNEAPTAHNENKKENNCPTYQSGMGGNMNRKKLL
ncbi:hypothetical protein HAZT_HAZT009264 [Hyalella azteca]|uniref:BHLH domain-containing protein n=1 Tax=Hyalella azteca TaxID=294128 RepID=A0A6A0H4V9_HYAAZ|nr:hypothetical protein HAZT_HAZT009264 [Hyalella azteca]